MNNLQKVWNDLDNAYEYMEKAIEIMSYISLSKDMKQLVEEMMEDEN